MDVGVKVSPFTIIVKENCSPKNISKRAVIATLPPNFFIVIVVFELLILHFNERDGKEFWNQQSDKGKAVRYSTATAIITTTTATTSPRRIVMVEVLKNSSRRDFFRMITGIPKT